MAATAKTQTMRERVVAVLRGERPQRLPFIDRLELWHRGLLHSQALPAEFADVPLTEIHRQVGIGQQKFLSPYSLRLRNVDVIVRFNGDVHYQESEPVVERFPDMDHLAPTDQIGVTQTEIVTPVGGLTLEHVMLEEALATGARAYMSKHAIVEDADYYVAEYIVEHMEYVPQYDRLRAVEDAIGEVGYVVPTLLRIPFQQVLIDYFSTETFFFALHDARDRVERLMALLDERNQEFLYNLAELDVLYVQFGDNLDGTMTNPRLFRQYALPVYQRYCEILHGQGKVVGSHTDGNIQSLFGLLAESGLDVCESISPAPLTPFTFEEIWTAWREDGPTIWGGIPCSLLEPSVPEATFRNYVEGVLKTVGNGRIILGVGDMVLPINEIARVRQIADMVEAWEGEAYSVD